MKYLHWILTITCCTLVASIHIEKIKEKKQEREWLEKIQKELDDIHSK